MPKTLEEIKAWLDRPMCTKEVVQRDKDIRRLRDREAQEIIRDLVARCERARAFMQNNKAYSAAHDDRWQREIDALERGEG